jgi:SAM-dependent methyltransferase
VAEAGGYVGRPGISPALATLIALGQVQRSQRILDVGCNTGTDALTLARWGFRRVVGVDPDPRVIATARSRATRLGLGSQVSFHRLAGEALEAEFGRRRFDVVLHTLVANNLRKGRDEHFRNLAAVLRPDGLLVLHERLGKAWENGSPGRVAPLAAAKRHFELTRSVTTHLAERPTVAGPGYAIVALWLGRPK